MILIQFLVVVTLLGVLRSATALCPADTDTINISSSVTRMRVKTEYDRIDSCYKNCHTLKTVTFEVGGGHLDIGANCFEGTSIEEIVFPKRVSYLGSDLFRSVTTLKKITFEEGNHTFIR